MTKKKPREPRFCCYIIDGLVCAKPLHGTPNQKYCGRQALKGSHAHLANKDKQYQLYLQGLKQSPVREVIPEFVIVKSVCLTPRQQRIADILKHNQNAASLFKKNILA